MALAQAAPAAVSAAALRRGPRLRTAGAMRALSTHQAEGVAANSEKVTAQVRDKQALGMKWSEHFIVVGSVCFVDVFFY